jgi:hypothetical protein
MRSSRRRSNPLRLLLLILCVSASCRANDRPLSDSWSAPLAVTPAQGGAAPVFAASPNGRLTLAWVSAPERGVDGRLHVRPDAFDTTTRELRDSLGSLSIYGEVPPKIAYAPNGHLYAAYLVTRAVPDKKYPENALRFATSADRGTTWSAPVTVTATASGDSVFGSYDDHALHVGADGTIYLSWLAMTGEASHTYFVRSTDGGATWSRPSLIDAEPSCPCCRTSMASAPDGSLYVAWRKIYPDHGAKTEMRDIVVARSEDHGQTWSAPSRVHADNWHVSYCPDAGPSIKVGADGMLHVAWWTGKEGGAGVRYTQSRDRGATFAEPIPLGVARYSRAAHVQLALGAGEAGQFVLATWDDGTRRIPQIVTRLSRDGGRTFEDAEALSGGGDQAGYPVVGMFGDTAIVAWQQRSLSAAADDSAAKARLDPRQASSYIGKVGALQVVARTKHLGR